MIDYYRTGYYLIPSYISPPFAYPYNRGKQTNKSKGRIRTNYLRRWGNVTRDYRKRVL